MLGLYKVFVDITREFKSPFSLGHVFTPKEKKWCVCHCSVYPSLLSQTWGQTPSLIQGYMRMITDSEKCWLGGNTGLWSKPYWKRIRPGRLLIYLAKTWKTPRVEVLSYNFTRKPNTVLLCSPGKEFLLFPWFLLVPLPKLSAMMEKSKVRPSLRLTYFWTEVHFPSIWLLPKNQQCQTPRACVL